MAATTNNLSEEYGVNEDPLFLEERPKFERTQRVSEEDSIEFELTNSEDLFKSNITEKVDSIEQANQEDSIQYFELEELDVLECEELNISNDSAENLNEASLTESSNLSESQQSDNEDAEKKSQKFTDAEIALAVVAGAFVVAGAAALFVFCPPAGALALFVLAKIGAATGVTAAAHAAIPVVAGLAKLTGGLIAGAATAAAGTVAGAATAGVGIAVGATTAVAGTVAGATTAVAGTVAGVATGAAGTVVGAATAATGTVSGIATATNVATVTGSMITSAATTTIGKIAIAGAGLVAIDAIGGKIKSGMKEVSSFLSKGASNMKESLLQPKAQNTQTANIEIEMQNLSKTGKSVSPAKPG